MMPKIIKILSPIHFLVCLSTLLHCLSLFLFLSTPQSVHCAPVKSSSSTSTASEKSDHFSLKDYENKERDDENDYKPGDDDHKEDVLTAKEIYEQFVKKYRSNLYNYNSKTTTDNYYYPEIIKTNKNYESKVSIKFRTVLVCSALVALFSLVASIVRCCLQESELSRESRARENNEQLASELALVVVLGREENSFSSVLLGPVLDHQRSPENQEQEEEEERVRDLPPTYEEVLQNNGNHQAGETVVNYHQQQQQQPPPPPPYSSDL